MRILQIEDDVGTASFVRKGLNQAGFSVDHETNGQDGLGRAASDSYDAIIVDVMLPSIDGLSAVRQLRRRNVLTPIVFLSAKASVDDRIKGLDVGGDDYLVKPFAFSELLARLYAVLRRARGLAEPLSLSIHDLSVDLRSRTVCRGQRSIDLQPREFALLEYLVRHKGHVVSKTMIMEHVWNYNFDPETNIVEARICRLREKIDRGSDLKLIHTIRGVGYVVR